MHHHYGQSFRKSESHADCKFRTRPLGCHHLGSGHSRPRHFCGTAGETAARLSAGHLWTKLQGAEDVPEISDAIDQAERPALADHGEAIARHYVTQLAASASVSNHSPLHVQPNRTFRLAVCKLVQSVQSAAAGPGRAKRAYKASGVVRGIFCGGPMIIPGSSQALTLTP